MENENQNPDQINLENHESEELKPGIIDIISGVFISPGETFSNLKSVSYKSSYWLIPLLVFVITAIIMNVVVMSNPDIKSDITYQQKQAVEKRFDDMVKNGKISKEEAERSLEQVEKSMEFMQGPVGMVINVVSTLVVTVLAFLLLSLVYFFIWTKVLGGSGNFKDSLTALGPVYYIAVIELIVMLVLSVVFGKLIKDIGIGSLFQLEDGILKFILSKINPFTFWSLIIQCISLSIFFDVSKQKSYITIFSLWIVYLVVAYGLGKLF